MSHFEWDMKPPAFPKVPPQSATRYQSLTVLPSSSYIPSTLLLVDFASQLLSRQLRIANPDSSFVPTKGFDSQVQLILRRAILSGRFSNIPFLNDPSLETKLLALPRPVTPSTLPEGTK